MNNLSSYDNELFRQHNRLIIGTDEAGRGAFAGPIVAAAVCFAPNTSVDGVKDSKKLSPEQREKAFEAICEAALGWSVCIVSATEIDEKGIDASNIKAMESSCADVAGQVDRPCFFVVDQCSYFGLSPFTMAPKMDGTSQCVAAASIIAKVTHDRILRDLDKRHPGYHLGTSMGYLNPDHKDAIIRLGRIPGVHRMSFNSQGITHGMLSLEDFF